MEQKYIILDSSEIDNLNWDLVYQTPDSIRYNLTNTRAIISVDIDSDYMSDKQSYNIDDIRVLIYTPEWNDLLIEE